MSRVTITPEVKQMTSTQSILHALANEHLQIQHEGLHKVLMAFLHG